MSQLLSHEAKQSGYFILNTASIIFTDKDIVQHIDSASRDYNGKTLIENLKAAGN